MDFDPDKFSIGVIDFFSILLPGALLSYALKGSAAILFGGFIQVPQGTAGWVAFLFMSYLLGHFILLISSAADACLYDPLKSRTRQEQIQRLAKGEGLSWRITRATAYCFFQGGVGSAVRHAQSLRDHYLGRLGAGKAMNAFQWCKSRLTLEKPEAMATIQRFEADSKFFRSLLSILLVFFILGLLAASGTLRSVRALPREGGLWISATTLVFWMLAFWRFVDQRVKATNQAYGFVIAMEAERENGFRFHAPDPVKEPTHAGGVVYRKTAQGVEYLLVQAKDNPEKWVLPKGHIEPWESPPEAAVREVLEEAHAWARVVGDLGRSKYAVQGTPIWVQVYLMELQGKGPVKEQRGPVWLTLERAQKLASHQETKDKLADADHMLSDKNA